MISQPPLHRLTEFLDLTAPEMDAIIGSAGPPIRVPRGGMLRREGDRVDGIYLLHEGWMGASMLLRDGGRQLVKIHLPGDLLGTPSLCLTTAGETLAALTDSVARLIPLAAFGRLFEEHSRVAACLMLSVQKERLALIDLLASVGRSSAIERCAAMLLDLHDRLEAIGQLHDASFDFPLTQEQVGDLLGLTSVHVNRVLRELGQQGCIARTPRRMTLTDVDALRRLSPYGRRRFVRDPGWIPAASATRDPVPA